MNKKLLAATLPLLGGAIIVGAGFSAWVFNTTMTAGAITGTVEVTELIGTEFEMKVYYDKNFGQKDSEGQALSVSYAELKTFNLVLDQGGVDNTNPATLITAYVPSGTDGTTADIDLAKNVYVEITYKGNADEFTALTNGYNVKFDITATVGDGTVTASSMNSYVQTGSTWASIADEDMVTDTSLGNSYGAPTVTNRVVYRSTALDFDWAYYQYQVDSAVLSQNPGGAGLASVTSSVKSNTDAKPKDASDWSVMNSALNTKTFTLTFSATTDVVAKS